jgi:ferrous iron transport protein B
MSKKKTAPRTVALAGQPNCGKSSVFTMLTGIHQHIANYPGITVDIKKGSMTHRDAPSVEIVDLPGTYSLTSFSEEERAACGFLLEHTPDVIVNVVDASNLPRQLYLTIQLVETGVPVILDLNMTDLAERASIKIDKNLLEKELGVPVAATAAHREKGKEELKAKIVEEHPPEVRTGSLVDYGELEEALRLVTGALESSGEDLPLAPRWIALKLLEQDEEIWKFCEGHPGTESARRLAREQIEKSAQSLGIPPSQYIAMKRHETARALAARVSVEGERRESLSDKVDRIVLHPVFGLFVLAGVMFSLYELAIVQGYRLTGYTWPLLSAIRGFISGILPGEGLLSDPLLRSSVMYVTDGVIAVLNYIPIFLILFALIAVLEDGGYMPRMSFVLDRLFRRFGLHGQSVLPLVLGGVFVGGCAVPGVMATRGIPDRRARLATIMVVPLMNCLAKVPFYTLLVSIYFASSQSIAMFFIASITLIVALIVSKVLTLTVLKHEPSAPFMMEMPSYHLPALRNVARHSLHRTWMFLRKIFTIVVIASAVVFLLTHYPQADERARQRIAVKMDEALSDLRDETVGTPYENVFGDKNSVLEITRYWQHYRAERMKAAGDRAARDKVDEVFKAENPEFFEIVTARKDRDARAAKQALMQFLRTRMELRSELNELQIRESILGRVGIGIETVTRYAGFNWRINVALLSAFAAKENMVATLGSLYKPAEEGERLEERMSREEGGFTSLHALAMMVFMALYPPCIATLLVVLSESGSLRWMLLTLFYPILLGLFFSILIFTGGSLLGLTGLQAMVAFYLIMLGTAAVLSQVKTPEEKKLLTERR